MAEVSFEEFLFNFHIIIFLSIILLFFIPLSVWPGRIWFHFWYVTMILASQILTGLTLLPYMIKSNRYRLVCPLTTWMQYVRGYLPKDPKNFDHSFVSEFGERIGLRIPKGVVSLMNIIILIIASILYFL